MKKPIDYGVPVFGLRIIERRVVGAGREDEQGGALARAGDEIVSHLRGEETIAIALDNEDGD